MTGHNPMTTQSRPAKPVIDTHGHLLVPEANALAGGHPREVAESAAELASFYAGLPTLAIGMTKRLFDHAGTATLEEQLEYEAQLQAAATQTDDFREGVAAFLEKREARFSGR